jgi:hypothetical protein
VVSVGGALEANWQSGDLRAWFDTSSDFLLSWKPFHYAAHIELSIGASYKLNLLLTSKTITVSLGVDLDLWGPAFAGRARVDLYVVSFTISFGDSQPRLDPISWAEFKTSFLPHPKAAASGRASLRGPGADPPAVFCDARVTGGLIRDLTRFKMSDADMDWLIDAEDFEVTVWCVCPNRSASLATKAGKKQTPVPGNWTGTKFGVGPVGIADGSLNSALTVSLDWTNRSSDGLTWVPDPTRDLALLVTPRAVTSSVPSAAWRRDVALNPVMSNINTQPRVVAAALTGVALASNVPEPAHTPFWIKISTLEATHEKQKPTFSWSAPDIKTSDTFDQSTATLTVQQTIDSGPAGMRAAILVELAGSGVTVSAATNVAAMARDADKVLLAKPVLMFLGEERAPTGGPRR